MYYETYTNGVSIELEEPIDQESKLIDVFFKKQYDGWSEKFRERREEIENVISIFERKFDQNQNLAEFYPLKKDLLNAFCLTPLDKVKVVIWGQDPYPSLIEEGKPVAQGYSFGVHRDCSTPGSLNNIYKEIKNTYPWFEIPKHGDIRSWAEQGVLFLNLGLTFCPHEKDVSNTLNKIHVAGWQRFIYMIVDILNNNVQDCIHVLWGKPVQTIISDLKSNYILTAAHPSPLSAKRGFFHCNHFLKINIALRKLGKPQIDWRIDQPYGNPTYVEYIKGYKPETEAM